MGDIVNLNKKRKEKKREEKKRLAVENRRRFGVSKAEKLRERTLKEQENTILDGKKLTD